MDVSCQVPSIPCLVACCAGEDMLLSSKGMGGESQSELKRPFSLSEKCCHVCCALIPRWELLYNARLSCGNSSVRRMDTHGKLERKDHNHQSSSFANCKRSGRNSVLVPSYNYYTRQIIESAAVRDRIAK